MFDQFFRLIFPFIFWAALLEIINNSWFSTTIHLSYTVYSLFYPIVQVVHSWGLGNPSEPSLDSFLWHSQAKYEPAKNIHGNRKNLSEKNSQFTVPRVVSGSHWNFLFLTARMIDWVLGLSLFQTVFMTSKIGPILSNIVPVLNLISQSSVQT